MTILPAPVLTPVRRSILWAATGTGAAILGLMGRPRDSIGASADTAITMGDADPAAGKAVLYTKTSAKITELRIKLPSGADLLIATG